MDDDELPLSTEQKFSVEAFSRSCEKLDQEQSLELLVSLYRRLLVQDNIYKYFLAQKWGVADSNIGLTSTPSATDNWFSEQLDNSTTTGQIDDQE